MTLCMRSAGVGAEVAAGERVATGGCCRMHAATAGLSP
jgi:hypothetical protein